MGDAITSVFNISAWVYDVEKHSMTLEAVSADNSSETSKVLIENYSESVKDKRIVFEDDEPIFDVFCAELDAGKYDIDLEYRIVSEDSTIKWVKQIGHTICDDEKKPLMVVGRTLDITTEKLRTSADIKKSVQDTLTGLYNRDKAKELIMKELNADVRGIASLILIDIDDFRLINENYGKMYADAVLQTVSGVLYTNFMNKDVVSRIAGDQFMVFCNDINEAKITELIKELKTRLAENVKLRNNETITVSTGIAFTANDVHGFYDLYNRADIALFYAKKNGRDSVSIYNASMNETSMGSTYRKMGKYAEEEHRVSQGAIKVNKKIFDYAFDLLAKESDVNAATTKIFRELCLHYELDRAVIINYDFDREVIKTALKWSKTKEDHDYLEDEYVSPVKWDCFENAAREDGYVVLENGRSDKIDFFRELLLLKNQPVSSVHYAIYDNNKLIGVAIFESYKHHDFNKVELLTLKSVLTLVNSYMLSHNVKRELEAEAIINQNVMDAQRIIFYVIDEHTHEIKYLSKYSKELFPGAQYGCKCYESFFGNSKVCDNCPIYEGVGDKNTVELYDEDNDRWYTRTATNMKNTSSDSDMLICVTDVTEFIKRVKSEDSLTVACSYDSFIFTSTRLIKHKLFEPAVICTGIREFSKINDEYGYVAGDKILKRFAELVKMNLYEDEIICRIKGDDFVILIKQAQEDVLRKRINYCTTKLTAEFQEEYPGIEIDCYAGAYNITDSDEYLNHCIDNALKARKVAYVEKDKHAGYYEYTRDIELKEQQDKVIAKMMKEGLTKGNFVVFFQPKVDVNTGDIKGAEALVRLKDNEGKMVSPGIFIPLAEKTGLVGDIDFVVYEQTFGLMAKWINEGKKVPLISVNVSRLHLLNDKFPEEMKNLAEKYGLNTSQVELEITESVFFEDTERLIEMIERLKSIGFIISMDDFGSGYSTLNFMKKLPADVIKIDGGFFMRNEMDDKSKAIISAILQLTKNLDFNSVSEGVETKEQVEFLKNNGGQYVQGYYFYKPMPAEEFERLI